MKKYILKYAAIGVIALGLCSCGEDFLEARSSTDLEAGAPATKKIIEQDLTAVYQILLFDSYADGNYNSYILMGDLRSDDLYKGGGGPDDQPGLHALSQFNNTPSNVPMGWWKIYYTGLNRANYTLNACKNAVDVSEADLNRLSAEARALRAYYVHNLWKMWGNIPYFEEYLDEPYLAKQYKADEIYQKIMADLDYAIEGDKLPKSVSGSNVGRMTKAAAQMIRARVVMYQKDASKYNQVLADMVEIINNPAYSLMPDIESIFITSGEFCKESIFETNQKAMGKDWGNAWGGFGTNLPAFISPENLEDPEKVFKGGWGFAPVRPEAYALYSIDDKRGKQTINDVRGLTYSKRFQDTGFFICKYAARVGYNNAISGEALLNYENNLRIFRLAEAYLNAAELIVGGATAAGALSAQEYLDAVRMRAFGEDFDSNKVVATLENIKKERRLEFLGEGLRYWDLVRWGDAQKVLTENIPEYSSVRTWNPSKNKYLPIPQSEIDNTKGTEFELVQNPY